MPGIKLLTKLDAKTCLKAAWRAAQDRGFSLTPIEDGGKRFTASKGSALFNMIAGGLAPNCEFFVTAETYGDGVELSLEKNVPWLTTGKMGVNKVNRQANDLMDAIACAIEKEGGAVLERKEF